MFTPRVSPVHRNLATSYVLVDALLDDLCLGGFSGIVEISLHDADYRLIIGRGQVAAIADSAGEDCGPTLIPDLAARGRKERGLLSIYRCSDESAWALIGRIKSKPLYSRLSTEFADLEKMMSKLQRETDREWFVEVETDSGLSGLIYINHTGVHSLASSPDSPEGEGALSKILEECKEAGATFSVYYRPLGEKADDTGRAAGHREVETVRVVERQKKAEIPGTRQLSPEFQPEYFATAAAESRSRSGPLPVSSSLDGRPSGRDFGPASVAEMETESSSRGDLREGEAQGGRFAAVAAGRGQGDGSDNHQATDPSDTRTIVPIEFGDASAEAEAMPEVKRLMAEIASTIEKTAREIEPRDTFSIYLRAGQLKIADRYPFLDPFGSEFEYHAGEIAFIGAEGPSAFVQGLTEALQLAVRSVVEASSQPERLRSRIQDNLEEISERLRPELESFGLDKAIQQITA